MKKEKIDSSFTTDDVIVHVYISKNYKNIIPYLVCSNSKAKRYKVIRFKSVTVAYISNGILDFDIKGTRSTSKLKYVRINLRQYYKIPKSKTTKLR